MVLYFFMEGRGILFDQTIQTLTRSLDYSTKRNEAITNNISNIDTPGYQAEKVSFKSYFNDALKGTMETKRTHPKHLDFAENHDRSGTVIRGRNSMYNHNKNNVDVDKEMAELAENQIYQQALVDRLNGKFSNIQSVLQGVS